MSFRVLPPVLIAVVLTVFASSSQGQTSPSTRLSLQDLPGVKVTVSPLAAGIEKDGLSAQLFDNTVTAKLKAAGIPILSATEMHETRRRPELVIDVGLLRLDTDEYVYSIRVSLRQEVASLERIGRPIETAIQVSAITWSSPNVFGIVPADQMAPEGKKIVERLTDEFAAVFKKANPGGNSP